MIVVRNSIIKNTCSNIRHEPSLYAILAPDAFLDTTPNLLPANFALVLLTVDVKVNAQHNEKGRPEVLKGERLVEEEKANDYGDCFATRSHGGGDECTAALY